MSRRIGAHAIHMADFLGRYPHIAEGCAATESHSVADIQSKHASSDYVCGKRELKLDRKIDVTRVTMVGKPEHVSKD